MLVSSGRFDGLKTRAIPVLVSTITKVCSEAIWLIALGLNLGPVYMDRRDRFDTLRLSACI